MKSYKATHKKENRRHVRKLYLFVNCKEELRGRKKTPVLPPAARSALNVEEANSVEQQGRAPRGQQDRTQRCILGVDFTSAALRLVTSYRLSQPQLPRLKCE